MKQKTTMRNNLIYILIFLLSGGTVFSQNITIDGNGTVKCPGQAVGYNETIGSKTYYVVDNDALTEFRDTGSFTEGGTTYTPNDMSCVCTTLVTDMNSLFENKATFNDDISNWDTSNVTNMYELFRDARAFDQDLSTWDTSNVRNMSKMFDRARNFNNGGNPSMFSNVSSVTTMFAMFWDARNFNRDIGSWDVSSVENMGEMFRGAQIFTNGDSNSINNWDVSDVKSMNQMFRGAREFDQPLNNWDVRKVENMGGMFYGAREFNQPLNSWVTDTLKVINNMFREAVKFNQPLSNWDISEVGQLANVFLNATAFNQNIGDWNVGNVTTMSNMFRSANGKFNNGGVDSLKDWNVSKVVNFQQMFEGLEDFNQPLNNWTLKSGQNIIMRRMFKNAKAFNQPLNNWDVSNVRYGNDSNSNMEQMFNGATVFNQDLSGWCVSNLVSQPTNFNSNSLMANEPAFQPRWGSACSPLVILTDSDSDDIIGPGQSMTVTATFDRTISGLAKYRLNNGASYSNMSKVNSSTWNFTIAANSLAENTYNISINATDTSSNTYDISVGTQNGNETGVDVIQFKVDKTSPSVELTHNHPDNIVGVSDTLLITATFNEAMTGTPTLSFSGLITDTLMDDSANPAVWTYSIDLSTLTIPNNGDYFVTIDGSDMAGNVYSNASGAQDGNETAVDRITFTYYNPPTVILTHNHPDNILIESDTFTVTATFSHAMTITPTLSFSGLITDALMNNSGDPAVWSYSIDLSTLTIPSNGDYFITVGGIDIAGNTYTNAAGAQDGNETAVDRITFTYYKPPTVILTHNHPDNSLDENDTVLVTATFSQSMNSTPTLSFSGLITETLMNNTGNPAVWNYSIDLSTLTIPNNGNYIISVGEEAPASIVRDGLVVHLDAADSNSYSGSGASWNDISGNGNNFTLFGSPSYDSNTNGGVINFDKTDDYAESISTSILNRNSYTKVAIYLPETPSKNIISGGDSDARHAFWMQNTTDFIRAGHNNDWDRVSFSPGNMLNSWHYSAVSFSDIDGFKLYYNGALEHTDTYNTLSFGNGVVRVGAYIGSNGDNNLFDGYIPIVLIYNRVLSLSEIQQNYNSLAQRYGLTPLGISFKLTDIIGNPYLTSNGVQDGNETSSDEITFAVDVTPLTVTLTDSDVDDIIYPTDSITVTATFSKAVQNSPTINFSGVGPKNIILSSTASQSVWSYIFDFPSLSVPVGQYTLTVSATDLFGNNIQGNENIVFDYRLFTPTITSSDTIDKIFGDPGFDVTATSSSTGAFSFQIANSSVASITATGSVTINGVGTTSITITQAADPNFSTASKTITLNVVEAIPIITTSPTIINKIFDDPDFSITATSSSTGTVSSTGAFSFQIADSNVASITATGSVTINGAGTTSITITQAADANFLTASKTITLIVDKAHPNIYFPDITKIYGDLDFTITATSSSTGSFSYLIDDPRVASISQSNTLNVIPSTNKSITKSPLNLTSLLLSISGSGSTTISALQAEDSNYNSATATMTLTVLKNNLLNVDWYSTSKITRTFGIPPFELIDPTVPSDYSGVFNFRSSDVTIASIFSKDVQINGVGTVTLFADIPADGNYESKTVTVTLEVLKANQSIIIEPLPQEVLKNFASLTVSATSTSGAPVLVSIANGSAANLSGTVGSYVLSNIDTSGVVTLTFTTDASAHPNYNSATVTLVIDVSKFNQNITIDPPGSEFILFEEDLTYDIDAYSDQSFNNLIYEIVSGTNALINGSTLDIFDIGELKIRVSHPGNNEFNAASQTKIITVLQGITKLLNFNIPEKFVNDGEFIISPPDSNRSGAIRYTSSDTDIAEIIGNKIIIKGIGSCSITAVQLGTAQFTSASISTIFIVNDTDFDNDGIGDTEDEDDDNDGMTDEQENENGTDPYNTDTDDDLLEDGDENEIGTDPNDIDTDKDGIIDGLDAFPLDPNESVDTDGDGIGDNTDNDANDDGFSDDEIFVSGLVTPGVIGSEGTWKIMNIENYPSAIVSIYNRNGFLVYSKMNYQNDWAGTFDQTGDLLPAGSYYYRIEVPGMELIEGWLYLTY